MSLVLSRRPEEKILIGDNIVVTVVEIRRGSVRLAFDAPLSIPVHRAELRPVEMGAIDSRHIELTANLIGRDIGKPPVTVVDERTNPRD